MIKIACMVGAPDLETPTLAPYSGDMENDFQRLAALGFDGIELMLRQPTQMDGNRLRDLLDCYGLTLVGLCTGHVFGEDGLGLVGPDLSISPAALQRAREFIDFASQFFAPGTLVNYGRFRGVGNPADVDGSLLAYTSVFQELADYAAPRQVRLILEPVSRNEVNFIHSTQEGLAMVGRVERPNFGIMLDTYHMHHEDVDIIESLIEAGPLCWHMHFSDSNRCYPGSADIAFDLVITALNRLGYNGYVGLEIKPWPNPDLAARNSIEYLRTFIPS